MATVHPSAIVHPRAQLAEDVIVGPYAVVEEGVTLAVRPTDGAQKN